MPGRRWAAVNEATLPGEVDGILELIVFTSGGVLLALEIIASRVLAPYFGNSIYVWGSLIGVFLTALSVGYAVGGRLADRHPSPGLFAGIVFAAKLDDAGKPAEAAPAPVEEAPPVEAAAPVGEERTAAPPAAPESAPAAEAPAEAPAPEPKPGEGA